MQRSQTAGLNVHRSALLFATVSLLALSATVPAAATTWCVAPTSTTCPSGTTYGGAAPSKVDTKVVADDTVIVEPATYTDCAVWDRPDLTIEADPNASGSVVLQNKVCNSKGIFVITGNSTTVGNNVTIEGITFEGEALTSGTGKGIAAGIRVTGATAATQATNPTIENCNFINDQEGILADKNTNSKINISDSDFDTDGSNIGTDPAHPIYIGKVLQLNVSGSTITNTQDQANGIQSRALNTDIESTTIEDGPNGNSSYLINVPNGGTVTISGNTLEKGVTSTQPVAIGIGTYLIDNPNGTLYNTSGLFIGNNAFTNDNSNNTIYFVDNLYTSNYANWQANVCSNTLTNNTAAIVYGLRQNKIDYYEGFSGMPSC